MAKHSVRQPEWIDEAPTQVEASVEIDATPAVVWTHVADHASWPKWFGPLDKVDLHASSTGVGGGRTVHVKKMAVIEEFTAWDVDEHFAFSVIGTKVPFLDSLAESVRLEPVGTSQCRLTYRQGASGKKGFGWLVDFGWKRAAGKDLPLALENLKQLIENDAST